MTSAAPMTSASQMRNTVSFVVSQDSLRSIGAAPGFRRRSPG